MIRQKQTAPTSWPKMRPPGCRKQQPGGSSGKLLRGSPDGSDQPRLGRRIYFFFRLSIDTTRKVFGSEMVTL